jgi:mannose-6-phosphate isomerase-like protein (cupin superfamily)
VKDAAREAARLKRIRWDAERDGPLSEAALRRAIEAQGYRVARYVYPPGTRFEDHAHDVDKIDAVVSGRFRMTMRGRSVVLEAGDRLAVPRGMVHNAEVVGDEEVVSLDATRAARDR